MPKIALCNVYSRELSGKRRKASNKEINSHFGMQTKVTIAVATSETISCDQVIT